MAKEKAVNGGEPAKFSFSYDEKDGFLKIKWVSPEQLPSGIYGLKCKPNLPRNTWEINVKVLIQQFASDGKPLIVEQSIEEAAGGKVIGIRREKGPVYDEQFDVLNCSKRGPFLDSQGRPDTRKRGIDERYINFHQMADCVATAIASIFGDYVDIRKLEGHEISHDEFARASPVEPHPIIGAVTPKRRVAFGNAESVAQRGIGRPRVVADTKHRKGNDKNPRPGLLDINADLALHDAKEIPVTEPTE